MGNSVPHNIFSYRPAPTGTLKDATAQLIDANGGMVQAAERTRVGPSTLSNYANPYADTKIFIPADVIAALELASGCHAVSDYLVWLRGGVVINLPSPDGGDVFSLEEWREQTAAAVEQFGSGLAKAGECLKQQKLTREDRGTLKGQIQELIQRLATAYYAIDRVDESNPLALPSNPSKSPNITSLRG